MRAAQHAPAPLRVGGLADIPDGGDGHKPRKPERRQCAAAGAQLGELVAPARSAHDAMQGVVHQPIEYGHAVQALAQQVSVSDAILNVDISRGLMDY